ncbi:MAG: hypothetical protein O7A08_12425 [SAR324 cluster bacterium]|nr:hypothetical protein [SAR324 cluster bacterium]MCZ6646539.1 hypothetical protein [SAR324 cluster bacterium]MCZ6728923.1 hypothetical protein [SAR324 cluster bacterium]MCZ6842488.1 hypothetical protein [SAR324 cluster bacterium]
MKANACRWGILVLLLACSSNAWGLQPETSTNAAGVIKFPTALDQIETHAFHGSLEIFDIGDPDLRGENFRYGLQIGNFQLLTDLHFQTEPEEDFDFGEVRAKLRILPLDEFGTDIAVGILGRFVEKNEERKRIDDREASLFTVVTVQLLPIEDAGPLVLNFYLDNLFLNIGFKIGLYQFISIVGEADYLHSNTAARERSFGRLGLEIEGEQNFYFQLYFSDRNDNFVAQVGTAF